MADSVSETRSDRRLQRFPALHFLQAFRIAIQFPQLLFASIAVLALALGQRVIDDAPFAPPDAESPLPWDTPAIDATGRPLDSIGGSAAGFADLLLMPFRSVMQPAAGLLSPGNAWTDAAYHWTHLLWALLVWAFFGAAITRVAAIKFAVDQTISVKSAARFGLKRFGAYLFAPLIPTAGLLFLWLLCTVGGWIARIPAAGPYIAALLWFVVLALGLVMALIVIGIAAGWPLMSPAIAAEDSESFDGFSRAFSYVYGRPLLGIRLIVCGLGCGVAIVGGVVLLAPLAADLGVWGVATGMGLPDAAELTADSTFFQFSLTDKTATSPPPETARGIATFWLNAAAVIVHGFAASLFWTLSTIAYFVLRQADDGTALDEVFLWDEEQPDALLPLVGVAASEQPVIERPLTKDAGTTPGASVEPEEPS
ncbi:MAG: hypothetical protein ACE5KM_10420 [Planctomycetaceae bacterium]